MSIGGGKPYADDGSARARSMAVSLVSNQRQEWRMAMTRFPFFAVPSVEAFRKHGVASTLGEDIGKPDPERKNASLAWNLEAVRFGELAATLAG